MRQGNKKQTLTEQLVRQITGYIRENRTFVMPAGATFASIVPCSRIE